MRGSAARSGVGQFVGACSTVVVVIGLYTGSLAGTSEVSTDGPPRTLSAILPDDSGSLGGPDEPDASGAERAPLLESGPSPAGIGDETVSSTASLDSADLGIGEPITLLRPAARRDVDIAVVDGLLLTGLRTTVLVPSAVHEVRLDMAIDGLSVFSADLPGGSSEELTFTLDRPIAADTTLSISVEERYGVTCTSAAVEPAAVRLVGNEFLFERVDHRIETIADFLPPVLHRAIVVVDLQGAPSLRSAAFELATALSRLYPTMPTVDVVHRDVADRPVLPVQAVSEDPFSRTVVLSDADEAEMRLVEGPAETHLEIAGPPGLIEWMAAAISEPELGFITKDSVRVEELAVDQPSPDLLARRTLSDAGVRRLEASGSRVLELPISLPQSAFGEPVDEIRVGVGGVAVASSTDDRDPVLTLWLNGDLQDSIARDESGRFDVEIVLDRSQVERDNVIVIRSELPLDCGDVLPSHDLTLDAGSWVEAEPGQSLPPSLDRFPQVTVGRLSVSVGPSDGEMELALATLGVLQGSSPLPIHPRAAPIDEVLAGSSAGLVVTNGQGLVAHAVARDLTTVRSEPLAFVSDENPDDLAFVSTRSTDTSHDVLVVFSPSPRLNRAFIDVVTDRGWSGFVGTAVGVRGDGEFVRSRTPASGMTSSANSALAESRGEQMSVARLFALGGLASLLLVVGVITIRFVLGTLRRLRC